MSRSYWLLIAALGGCLSASLAGCALAQAIRDDAGAKASAPKSEQTPAYDPGPALSRIQNSLDGIASAIEAAKDNPYAKREQQRDEEDLRAQKHMAFWAKLMFFAAFASALLTLAGVFLIWRTLVYTKRTLEEAEEVSKTTKGAARVSEMASQIELRAYLHIAKTTFHAVRTRQTGKVKDWYLTITWENSGATPTRFARHCVNYQTFVGGLPKGFAFPTYAKEFDHLVIGPRSTIESAALTVQMSDMVATFKQQTAFFVWGWIEYNDIFAGTPRHRTEFCHQWIFNHDPTGAPDISLADSTVELGANFAVYSEHNGADDECTYKPLTHPTDSRRTVLGVSAT